MDIHITLSDTLIALLLGVSSVILRPRYSWSLDLDLERSPQTPDMAYHVDEWRRRTNEGDSWNSRWKSPRQILCQCRSTGGLFGGVKRISLCRCWCQDAFELVLMVTPGAWICSDKTCGRHCHKTMDNLEHSCKPVILPTMLKSRPLQLLNHHWHAALLPVVTQHEPCCSLIYSFHIVNILLEIRVQHSTAVLQGRPYHCEICDLLRMFWTVL